MINIIGSKQCIYYRLRARFSNNNHSSVLKMLHSCLLFPVCLSTPGGIVPSIPRELVLYSMQLHVRLQLVAEGEAGVAPRADVRPRSSVGHQMLNYK